MHDTVHGTIQYMHATIHGTVQYMAGLNTLAQEENGMIQDKAYSTITSGMMQHIACDVTKHTTGFDIWHDLPCRAGPALDDATFERLSTYLKQECSVSDQELSVIKANLVRCESNPLDDEQLWIQLQHGPIHTLMSTFKQEWQRRRSQFVASIAVSDCTTETAQDSEQMVCSSLLWCMCFNQGCVQLAMYSVFCWTGLQDLKVIVTMISPVTSTKRTRL